MTRWDPSSFGEPSSGDGREGSAEGFELPLELYFAEDRGDPEAVAARASLESGVLDRVGSERGFVSKRERRAIRALRGVAMVGALCVLLGAAVADRLGVAPWNGEATGHDGMPVSGPVSGLVASTGAETAGTIEQAMDLRDRLLRVVSDSPGRGALQSASPIVAVTLVQQVEVDAEVDRVDSRRRAAGVWSGGPYLTAQGFGVAGVSSATTVIRFEDGFSVPAMADGSPSELRWPASCEAAASAVSFDGGSARQRSVALSPAWYSQRSRDAGR